MRYQAALRPDCLDYSNEFRRGLRCCWPRAAATRLRSCRYNECFMTGLMYAAVTYVRSPAGMFVEEMRRDLHPAHTHADAHITILPPRPLHGTEEQAIQQLQGRSAAPSLRSR